MKSTVHESAHRLLCAMIRVTRAGGCLILLLLSLPGASASDVPLPSVEPLPEIPLSRHAGTVQARTRAMIRRWHWPDAAWQELREKAARPGYGAALLYLLEGEETHLSLARQWLLKLGDHGGDLGRRALEADEAFFDQGQPWLGDVYYKIDHRPFLAYLWLYPALNADERRRIEGGFLTSARFRMRAMTRWSHTPNLMFKPTVMAAMAGLVIGDEELIQWGFYRGPGSGRGGYFPVLKRMLLDGGPWHEAPIYAVAHDALGMMLAMSRLLGLADGQDWFSRRMAGGGSPRGLLDYYLDTTYPAEPLGNGKSRFRVATYGDGATGPSGDLFLVDPTGGKLNLHGELALAYALPGETRYAAFLRFLDDYRPVIPDRPPLPDDSPLPPAPSRLWPDFGLAMLRSVESADYWQDPRAMAVLQIQSQDYGHSHADAFAITLHGAGRLLYPDYNAVQYENLSKGWTRTSVAHNTLVVDGENTRRVEPDVVRHEFGPHGKFLATTATGVFEQVTQTRALLLTRDYLLDLFHARSPVTRTFDYVLSSLGRPAPLTPGAYRPSRVLQDRYWSLSEPRAMTTDESWRLDFVIDEAASRRRRAFQRRWLAEHRPRAVVPELPADWFAHRAAVRVTMTGSPETLVVHGEAPHHLGMLVARRAGRPETLYAVIHEPFAGDTRPRVAALRELVRTPQAGLFRVEAEGFTDYVAVAWDGEETTHALQADDGTTVSFRDHAYLRIHPDGRAVGQGHWQGARLREPLRSVVLEGTSLSITGEGDFRRFGEPVMAAVQTPPELISTTLELDAPAVVRLPARGGRSLSVVLRNPSDRTLAGTLYLDTPPGLQARWQPSSLSGFAPGTSRTVTLRLDASDPEAGMHLLPLGLESDGPPVRHPTRGIQIAVGPTLESLYRHPDPAIFRIHAPAFSADLDMHTGALLSLRDDHGAVQAEANPLFTIADGEQVLMDTQTENAFTWPKTVPASVLAQARDRVRWQTLAFYDRLMIRLDPHWTGFPAAIFTVFPEAGDHWETMEVLDVHGHTSSQSRPGSYRRHGVVALKLMDAGRSRTLCLQLVPHGEVSITGTRIRFSRRVGGKEQWTVGSCDAWGLSDWVWKDW